MQMRPLKYIIVILAIFLFGFLCCKQPTTPVNINLEKFGDGIHHWFLFATNTNYHRFDTNDFISIGENIIKFQNEDGGWPKNIDWLADVDADSLIKTLSEKYKQSTFDNDNTHPQIDFLAQLYTQTGKEEYRIAAEKGLIYILNTQNTSGGWRGWDVDAITFNDNVTNGIMDLLIDIKQQKEYFRWINNPLKSRLDSSLNAAIKCVLNCQIITNGDKTAWCQQHDHKTLAPVGGRSFELPSIASRESVNIVRMLMNINEPDSAIIDAINSAVKWFELSKLYNIKVIDIPIPADTYKGQNLNIDRRVETDTSAPPIWARFYQLEDNKPFMCRRDGQKVYSLEEVNPERRGGYSWYGYWPQKLIEKEYPRWTKCHLNTN